MNVSVYIWNLGIDIFRCMGSLRSAFVSSRCSWALQKTTEGVGDRMGRRVTIDGRLTASAFVMVAFVVYGCLGDTACRDLGG
jgi:hypothetical protein